MKTAEFRVPTRTRFAPLRRMTPVMQAHRIVHHVNETSVTAHQVHDDIEHSLSSQHAAPGTLSEKAEFLLKGAGRIAWHRMKTHPFLAAAGIGAGAIAAAAAVGVAELTFASALAFAAYKVLREGEPPLKALEDVERQLHP